MTSLEQEDVRGSANPAVVTPLATGIDALPLALLSAAIDDPQRGIVIFDAHYRLLHITSQIAPLLQLKPSLRERTEALDMLGLLSMSTLDESSIEAATRTLKEFGPASAPQSILLTTEDASQSIQMRLRSVGQDYRIASFEVAPGQPGNDRTNQLALQDSLTGLASRRFFEDTLTQILERGPEEPVTLFLIDLERFKAVNDTLGHGIGDSLLKLAAERLRAAVRKNDMVARLGGDEFAILIHPAATPDDTILIAHRILDLVQRTYLIEGQLVNIGTSIGIARSPGDGNQGPLLLRSADLALYHAKSSGRAGYHFFEDHMERRAQARRTSELELRRALALRQLELFYQPQVDTANNRLLGFEALLRWRHPEKGMIPPLYFLPIAEEIGVIVPIGEWVLRTACREAMNWPPHVTIAVNVSPVQFDAGNFAEIVKQALASTGLPGERLEIEVTEGILLKNEETVLKTIADLRAMKVRIAMDDFGTGYASLSQLAHFPFDKIKIDRSLAGFEGDNPKQRAIVRAITSLGLSLGVSTLAEGVETADQITRLQLDGCSSVQGFFFGRPVPTSEIKEILGRFPQPT